MTNEMSTGSSIYERVDADKTFNARLAAMFADPECVGELLLVGVALARCIYLGDPPLTESGRVPTGAIAESVYGRGSLPSSLLGVGRPYDRVPASPYRRLASVFYHDRRRYEPDDGRRADEVACGRPMSRPLWTLWSRRLPHRVGH